MATNGHKSVEGSRSRSLFVLEEGITVLELPEGNTIVAPVAPIVE